MAVSRAHDTKEYLHDGYNGSRDLIVTNHVRNQSSQAAIIDAGDEKREASRKDPQISSFAEAIGLRFSLFLLFSSQFVRLYRLRLSCRHCMHDDKSSDDRCRMRDLRGLIMHVTCGVIMLAY